MKPLRVLVACEESQEVCKAFRELGHEAYSCDVIQCSGGHPEWHIHDDVLKHLRESWDIMIAFPPCTYLTVAGNSWFNVNKYGESALHRIRLREDAIRFVKTLWNADIPKIAIENPIGVLSTRFRKPSQIIQPCDFGSPERKATCLWLKNLPALFSTECVVPDLVFYKDGRTDSRIHFDTLRLPKEERALIRSKTFPGVAKAMASQWGCL